MSWLIIKTFQVILLVFLVCHVCNKDGTCTLKRHSWNYKLLSFVIMLHLFQVWRLMRRKQCRPNAIHYNLLLRAVRDCSVGSEEHVQELLLPSQQSVSRRKIRFSNVMERKDLQSRSLPISTTQSSVPVTLWLLITVLVFTTVLTSYFVLVHMLLCNILTLFVNFLTYANWANRCITCITHHYWLCVLLHFTVVNSVLISF